VFLILGGISLALFLGSLLALPLLVVAIPEDYFLGSAKDYFNRHYRRHPLMRVFLLVLKNLVGIVLLCMGLVMLFTPGQGLLTLFMGLLLVNFPGKRTLELRLIRHAGIARAVAWIRRKAGVKTLLLPDNE